MSMPFSGSLFTFTNPDGSTIQVRGWGDQHYAVFETLDGYTIVKDPVSGFYEYAALSPDKSSLEPSGVRVGQTAPAGLMPRVRIRREAAKQRALAQAQASGERRWEARRRERQVAKRATRAVSGPGAMPQAPAAVTVGNYVGLCLLIQFPDVPGTIPRTEVDAYCNHIGYSGYGNHGSVRDYFFDTSDGKLHYTNVVTAYYTAANPRSYYTDPTVAYGTRARALIVEALNSLVAAGFDFGQLTADSSNYIYACNVFYAGTRVNNWSEGLWPHSWSLAAPFVTASGKRVYDYQITDMGAELSLGTFCHENGHMICNFPDLYDYGYESSGAGRYCLMAFGGSNQKNPVEVGAYLKYEAGWATTLTTITPGMTASVTASQNDLFVYPKNATEYFILENRQQQGRDASLPDAGLAIWHVDELGSNNNEQMTPTQHYECSLEQADNQFHLEHNVNSGDAEDLFSAPHQQRFAHDTTPSSHWWDGSASGLNITAVSAPGQVMMFSTGGGVELHRYWNPAVADHFYTTNWSELGPGNYGWVYEGVACRVHGAPQIGTVPLHRYWNATVADHFYTTNWAELGGGVGDWVYEGVACHVYPTPEIGTVPLYRYWNAAAADHFYTTDWNELGGGNYGWVFEHVECFVMPQPSPAPGGQPAGGGVPSTFATRTSARTASGGGVPSSFRTSGGLGPTAIAGSMPGSLAARSSARSSGSGAGGSSVPATFRTQASTQGAATGATARDSHVSVTVNVRRGSEADV